MWHRLIPMVVVVGLFGCSTMGSPQPTPNHTPSASGPAPSATPVVTAMDLSGAWVFGRDEEPPAGPVATCYPYQVLNLVQTGDRLTGQVTVCPGPCYEGEQLEGTNVSGEVRLSGRGETAPGDPSSSFEVEYRLRFERSTQHLVGTRNGEPFWAAPSVARPKEDCGPAPL